MAKQLMLATASVQVSHYMQDDKETYEVTHLVWAEDEAEATALLEAEYPTDEYSIYRYVHGVSVSPVLGAPEGGILS